MTADKIESKFTSKSQTTKVFFVDDNLSKCDGTFIELITLELPRKTMLLGLNKQNLEIYETLSFNEKHRSWFLNNNLCNDGRIYLTTKVDPMFLFIQYLEENCKSCQPLNQILRGSSEVLIEFFKSDQMRMVSDRKGPEDLNAYQFNESKTMQWLQKKVNNLVSYLKSSINIVNVGSSSSNFVKVKKEESDETNDDMIETAIGLISEYISLELLAKLESIYGITDKRKQAASLKRKSDVLTDETNIDKKVKLEDMNSSIELHENVIKAPPKLNTKDIKLQKAAKGTKSISSFFTKK